ncbi:MAG: nucleotidyltransferase [Bacteroidia bacterium]|nr:nucleotidyltransferase [Bacteroidia bacterium]
MKNDQLDVRWKQRFSNYKKALSQLDEFMAQPELNKLEEQGLIKAFEYTYELAWNTLKDYLEYQGETDIAGSRDAFRKSYAAGLITDGEIWMDMLQSRNKTSHTYNEETAADIVTSIKDEFYSLFSALKAGMEKRAKTGE